MADDKNPPQTPTPEPNAPQAPPASALDMWRAREACRLFGIWNGPRSDGRNRPPYSLKAMEMD